MDEESLLAEVRTEVSDSQVGRLSQLIEGLILLLQAGQRKFYLPSL